MARREHSLVQGGGVLRGGQRPAGSGEPSEKCSPLNQSQAEAWVGSEGDNWITVETDWSQGEAAA